MLTNITLEVETHLLETVQRHVQAEQTTLNEVFRQWLQGYVQAIQPETASRAMHTLKRLQTNYPNQGQVFSREERKP